MSWQSWETGEAHSFGGHRQRWWPRSQEKEAQQLSGLPNNCSLVPFLPPIASYGGTKQPGWSLPSKQLRKDIHWTETSKGLGQTAGGHWDIGLRVCGLYRLLPDDEPLSRTMRACGLFGMIVKSTCFSRWFCQLAYLSSAELGHLFPFALWYIGILLSLPHCDSSFKLKLKDTPGPSREHLS